MTDKNKDVQNNDKPKEDLIDEKQHIAQAHEQAESDMKSDPDLKDETNPADDLDEGEMAKLEAGE